MASVLDIRRLIAGTLAVLLTATLIWFGTGLTPWWPCMWFAPLPVLLFAAEATWWAAGLVALAALPLGMLNIWDFFMHFLRLPPGILVRIYAVEGIVFALAVLLYRALLKRGAHWTALLAFPALLVSFEWLLNLTSPHGTGGSLAYSQLAFLPFLQLAYITGPWGMSFLLLMFPTSLALGWRLHKRARPEAIRLLGVTGGVLAAVLIFGTVRLMLPPPAGSMVKVGLVASDGDNEDVADDGQPTAKLFQAYAKPVAALAEQGAQVVVLPEKLGVALEPDLPALDAELQSLAEQAHVRVVAGLIRVVPPTATNPLKLRYNEARVYTPGLPVASYDKEHMLPPFESNLTPGTDMTLLPGADGKGTWGVAICKDMDFTPLGRRYGQAGAGLMLVPGWDFFGDWIQHGHMAIMRGVESGFGVVRAAKGGSLYVSDNRGRVLAEVKSDAAPFSTLLAEVPTAHDGTLFLLLGDWFAWVAVLLLVYALARLLPVRRRGA